MLNINGKQWSELKNNDIEDFLSKFTGEADNDENFFFEFKAPDVKNQKIANEVCAFSNTYGGYIFVGVADSKEIVGSDGWSEERIQNLICDSITPLPNYTIRKFIVNDKTIIVIRVEEGSRAPYITNKGEIFERVSSGCRKLVDSDRLSAIYKRNQEHQERLKERLSNEPVNTIRNDFPNNIVALLDIGFETVTNDMLDFQKRFYEYKPHEIADRFAEYGITSLYRMGNTYNISFGHVSQNSGAEERDTMLQAGLNNFMVVYPDGAVKMRCILSADSYGEANIDAVMTSLESYKRVYDFLFPDLFEKFVYASKYEQLNVVKSFRPAFSDGVMQVLSEGPIFKDNKMQVGNVIYTGGRVPSYGYINIDKNIFNQNNVEFNTETLFDELFRSFYSFMGMI